MKKLNLNAFQDSELKENSLFAISGSGNSFTGYANGSSSCDDDPESSDFEC